MEPKELINSKYLLLLFIITFSSCKKETNVGKNETPKIDIRDSLIGEYMGIKEVHHYDYVLQKFVDDTTNCVLTVSKNERDSVIELVGVTNKIDYFLYDGSTFENIWFYHRAIFSITNGELYYFNYPSQGPTEIRCWASKI